MIPGSVYSYEKLNDHSEKKMLYTGIQPLVFHCCTHVIHGGSICQIYMYVEHCFPLVMLYTAM